MIRVILDVDIIFSLKERFSPKLFNLLFSVTKIVRRQSVLHLLCQYMAAPLSSQNAVIQRFPAPFVDGRRSSVTFMDTMWYRRESKWTHHPVGNSGSNAEAP